MKEDVLRLEFPLPARDLQAMPSAGRIDTEAPLDKRVARPSLRQIGSLAIKTLSCGRTWLCSSTMRSCSPGYCCHRNSRAWPIVWGEASRVMEVRRSVKEARQSGIWKVTDMVPPGNGPACTVADPRPGILLRLCESLGPGRFAGRARALQSASRRQSNFGEDTERGKRLLVIRALEGDCQDVSLAMMLASPRREFFARRKECPHY
jgi:hypothetical protein